ncbi:hypothetical protein [Microbacterium testaceum]|nr:hypothetical protein [Microbacterium testaceum]
MRALLLDRRAQPEYNLIRDPLGQNAPSMWSTFGGGAGGGTPVALTSVASALLGGFAGRITASSGATSTNAEISPMRDYQVRPDARGRIGLLMWMRASTARPAGAGYIRFRGTSYDGIVRLDQPIGTSWTLVRATATNLPTDRAYGATYKEDNGGSFAAGEWIEATRARLVQGDAPLVYSGPDTPGWKSRASGGSVGWPYTLDSIAGKPMASIEGDGVQAAISGQPFDPFSVYWVYDAYSPAAEWTEPFAVLGAPLGQQWSTGWATHGALSFGRRNLSDYTYAHSRLGTGPSPLDNRNGISPTRMNETRAWEVGRHVVAQAMTFPGGTDASLLTMIDGKIDHVMTYAGGAGIGIARALIRARTPSASANLPTPVNTNALAIRGLFYAANHDRTTRLAVARWLANRYGTALTT